jgi:hypothetical protein
MLDKAKQLSMSERLLRFRVHPFLMYSIAWLFVVYSIAAFQPAMISGDGGFPEANTVLRILHVLEYFGWAMFGYGIILTAEWMIMRITGEDRPPPKFE